jgi:hypothetical protein
MSTGQLIMLFLFCSVQNVVHKVTAYITVSDFTLSTKIAVITGTYKQL